jgi:hypothetical protein
MATISDLGPRIAIAVQNGQIASADRRAMDMAISAIDRSLAAPGGSGRQYGLGDLQFRIDDLIKAQVASGTISPSQASELRGYFSAGDSDSPQSEDGREDFAPRVPPPEQPPEGRRSQLLATPAVREELDSVMEFIQKMRERFAVSSSGYGALGTSPIARISPFVLDIYV